MITARYAKVLISGRMSVGLGWGLGIASTKDSGEDYESGAEVGR